MHDPTPHHNDPRTNGSDARNQEPVPPVPNTVYWPASPAPSERRDLPIEELRYPTNSRAVEPARPVEPVLENSHESKTVTPLGWIKRGSSTILGSSESYSTVGNLLISIDSWAGLVGHPLCGLYAIWNQFRSEHLATRFVELPSQREEAQSKWQPIKDMLASPGVYRMGLAVTYAASACEALWLGS